MVFETLLDPVMSWSLDLPLWLSIAILSFLFSLLITVVYRFATDQAEMKRLKEKTKKFQKEMRSHRDNPTKLAKIQKEAMQVNMAYMGKSLKPTLYTMLPLLLVFAWMNAAFSVAPLDAGQEFTVSVAMQSPDRILLDTELEIVGEPLKETIESQASWRVFGPAGAHTLTFISSENATASHPVVIGDKALEGVIAQDAPFVRTEVHYQKATPFGDFSMFGYNPGWLFTYILFSMFFSISLRKLMKVY